VTPRRPPPPQGALEIAVVLARYVVEGAREAIDPAPYLVGIGRGVAHGLAGRVGVRLQVALAELAGGGRAGEHDQTALSLEVVQEARAEAGRDQQLELDPCVLTQDRCDVIGGDDRQVGGVIESLVR
jgi:hypothetical protein